MAGDRGRALSRISDHALRRLPSFHGPLLAMGGGQDPDALIRPRFVEMAGGWGARIAVIPTASSLPDAAPVYVELFHGLGAADVWVVDPDETQVNHPAVEGALGAASGIFVAGGDQKKLVRLLRGSLTARCLLAALQRGTPVLTTSASTSALSDVMIAGLNADDSVRTGPGLGILGGVTIETHVSQRARHHRLEALQARGTNELILGIDENCALHFTPQTTRAEVIGRGGVVAYDAVRTWTFSCGETIDLAQMMDYGGKRHGNGNGQQGGRHQLSAQRRGRQPARRVRG